MKFWISAGLLLCFGGIAWGQEQTSTVQMQCHDLTALNSFTG